MSSDTTLPELSTLTTNHDQIVSGPDAYAWVNAGLL